MEIQDEKKIDDLAFQPTFPNAPRLIVFLKKEQQSLRIIKIENIQ
jgi:hypothetical protein